MQNKQTAEENFPLKHNRTSKKFFLYSKMEMDLISQTGINLIIYYALCEILYIYMISYLTSGFITPSTVNNSSELICSVLYSAKQQQTTTSRLLINFPISTASCYHSHSQQYNSDRKGEGVEKQRWKLFHVVYNIMWIKSSRSQLHTNTNSIHTNAPQILHKYSTEG